MNRSNKNNGVSLSMRVLMLLILVVCAGVFLFKMIDYTELMRQKGQLQEQKEQYEQKIEELTYRLNSPIDYDDNKQITWKKYGETVPPKVAKDMSVEATIRMKEKPLFSYFLDGSRHTYKVDDIADHRIECGSA